MEKISKTIKDIYNTHLIISRKVKGKPFKPRNDFKDMENDPSFHKWKILEHFFQKFPNINKEIYFKAPYELWKDKDYFAVDFYITPVATRAYTTYKKQLQQQDPDFDESLNYIKESLMFISKYCKQNSINLDEYILERHGSTYTWMKHIRSGLISPYVIFGFNNIDNIVYNTPNDERELLLGEFSNKLYHYKEKYNKSKYAKQLITIGLKKIKIIINPVEKN